MKILGIDPGSRCTGWGMLQGDKQKLAGIAAGCIRAQAGAALHQRLAIIYSGLSAVIDKYQPDAVAVEAIFSDPRYAKAAIQLGHARGVALLAATQAGLPIETYSPNLVKRSITGRGHAEKDQVAKMVSALLGWHSIPARDATDALALAITHHLHIGRQRGDTDRVFFRSNSK